MNGAQALPGVGVRFSVWAPHATHVAVELLGGAPRCVPLAPAPGQPGVFEALVDDVGAGDDYRFRLDDRLVRADPASRHQPQGVHGASRVVDPTAFAWSDGGWTGVSRADLVFYELHVGTFTEAGTFDAAIAHLPALRELGITAVELMPVAQFPGARNWGYDGVFPYAPQNSYGGPQGLRRLVDAAHGFGLAVVLDVVYNHLGPEGNVLADFGPYFTDAYRTPWGAAVNFDGSDSDGVRAYFLDNARHWLEEYHLDGLRLDAVHAIHDESARPFLAELAETVRACEKRRGHTLHVVAESDANDSRLVREVRHGGLGLDAVWNDDYHHAVHAALTGERTGYYEDFGGVEPVARALAERFVYDGRYSVHRRRRHGAPARDVPADRFVVFVQNHDQIGNRALGERLAALVGPARLRLAASLLLLAPGLPLLFMGEEYGETNPFLYFVSHGDPALLDAVRRGRRREFAAFVGEAAVPDPAAEDTFQRSRLDRARASGPQPAGLLALHRALLLLRREEPALRPGAAEVRVQHDAEAGWIRVHYVPERGRPGLAAFHLGRTPEAKLPLPAGGHPWRLRIDSQDGDFGGPGSAAPRRLAAGAPALPLAPESAVYYAGETA